jgi:hypothetical protein
MAPEELNDDAQAEELKYIEEDDVAEKENLMKQDDENDVSSVESDSYQSDDDISFISLNPNESNPYLKASLPPSSASNFTESVSTNNLNSFSDPLKIRGTSSRPSSENNPYGRTNTPVNFRTMKKLKRDLTAGDILKNSSSENSFIPDLSSSIGKNTSTNNRKNKSLQSLTVKPQSFIEIIPQNGEPARNRLKSKQESSMKPNKNSFNDSEGENILMPSQNLNRLRPAELEERLKQSVDPLLKVFERHHSSLPITWKAKLLSKTKLTPADHLIEVDGDKLRSIEETKIDLANVHRHFDSSVQVLKSLRSTASQNLFRLSTCEKLVSEIFDMTDDEHVEKTDYQDKVEALYRCYIHYKYIKYIIDRNYCYDDRKLGVLEASKMFVDVQLSNYRGLFEEIQAVSESSFPSMIRDVPALRKSYKLFLSVQAKSVRI